VLAEKEKLDVEAEALSLIASRAEGSVQDAEVVLINSASWIKRTLFPWCKNSHVVSK
jgi:DNA polymerase III gamma/tau subunit